MCVVCALCVLCAFFGAKTHVVCGREIREDKEIREFKEGKASIFSPKGKKNRGHRKVRH